MASSPFESTWIRAHVPAITIINLVIALLLFVARDWRTQGQLLTYALKYQSTISFVVQLISAVLSASNMYSLFLSINLTQRLRLTRKWIPFDSFIFWTAFTSDTFNSTSLAPVTTDQPCGFKTLGASFSSSSRGVWDSQFEFKEELAWNCMQNCRSEWREESLFTNCPVSHLNGFLLRAAEVSAANSQPMPKFDASGYTYTGRSYGAGSGVGTAPGIKVHELHDALSTKNSSSNLFFKNDVPQTRGNQTIYHIEGYLPSSFNGSETEKCPVTSGMSPFENMTAWSALHKPHTGTNILPIAAGTKKYNVFNQTQCEIRFQPRHMLVKVNVTNHSFTVDLMNENTQNIHSEPSGNHTAAVVRTLNLLSRMTSHLYVSEVGEVLLSSLEGRKALSNATKLTKSLVLESSEKVFTNLIDNILSAYRLSQIYLANNTNVIAVSGARCIAVRLGSDLYIAICLTVNALVAAYVCVNFLMHNSWDALPAWDARTVQDFIRSSHVTYQEVNKSKTWFKGGLKRRSTFAQVLSLLQGGDDPMAPKLFNGLMATPSKNDTFRRQQPRFPPTVAF
ncbi:hypothetical protein EDB81DRAFT_766663 [Dactylonectria macrodidyma]|uniref:Uncharacterized protein n=1 Tax=Dactylonectria macrodidyma TaxID=307937 RepID=A0A9P9DJH0_9HYPO|nr:hypothetical protein EDB81DRAFT_766663 [Dactylonectria macrodidyma]